MRQRRRPLMEHHLLGREASLVPAYSNISIGGAGNLVNQVQYAYNAFGQSIDTAQAHAGAVTP